MTTKSTAGSQVRGRGISDKMDIVIALPSISLFDRLAVIKIELFLLTWMICNCDKHPSMSETATIAQAGELRTALCTDKKNISRRGNDDSFGSELWCVWVGELSGSHSHPAGRCRFIKCLLYPGRLHQCCATESQSSEDEQTNWLPIAQ